MVYVVLGLAFATLFSFLGQYFRLSQTQIITYKCATSLFFVMIAVVGYVDNHEALRYFIFILAGGIAGLLGDFFLGLKDLKKKKKHNFLLFGMVAFFVGHISYIGAISETLHYRWYMYTIISFLVFFAILIYILNQKFIITKYKMIHFIYIIPSSILFSVSWLHTFNGWQLYAWVMAIGVTLFVISDVLLIHLYYKKFSRSEYKQLKRLNLAMYYLGQFAIALSVYFFV